MFSKNLTKEVMPISTDEMVQIIWRPKLKDKKRTSFKDATTKYLTLKELLEKKYPFSDLDLSRMLGDLFTKGLLNC